MKVLYGGIDEDDDIVVFVEDGNATASKLLCIATRQRDAYLNSVEVSEVAGVLVGWLGTQDPNVMARLALAIAEWLAKHDRQGSELYNDAADSIRRAIAQAGR